MSIRLKSMILGTLLVLTVSPGCSDPSAQVAREAADRQAQQNTAMAELHQEVASGTHELVGADARARQDIFRVHQDLQQERARLDAGWTGLHGEQRSIAADRKTESMFVSVATIAGSILIVVMLLGFCRHILSAAQQEGASTAELEELLVNEVLSGVLPRLPTDASPTPQSPLPATSPPLLESDAV